jgi:hypothetical protein
MPTWWYFISWLHFLNMGIWDLKKWMVCTQMITFSMMSSRNCKISVKSGLSTGFCCQHFSMNCVSLVFVPLGITGLKAYKVNNESLIYLSIMVIFKAKTILSVILITIKIYAIPNQYMPYKDIWSKYSVRVNYARGAATCEVGASRSSNLRISQISL